MPAGFQAPIEPIGLLGIKGRNGSDNRLVIPKDQCLEAYNIDWFHSSLGRKRGGSSAIGIAGGTAMAGGAQSLFRHVPAADQTAAEFWAVDGTNAFHRLAGGVAWADPIVLDAITANPQEVNAVSFNGNLYFAYKNAHNRLHMWDGLTLRRVGEDTASQVVTIVLAGGAVTDTRKYRVAFTKQSGGVTITRGNLGLASASQGLVAQQATVTRPAAPNEGETHWELYGASTTSVFGDYRLIATTVIATTTAVDNAALPVTVAPADGANTPPPSARYLSADDARVIMGGAWEVAANAENAMAPKNNRVWWTSILGASDVGDGERISNTGTINNYADIEEAITGISQPMQLVTAAASSLERGAFYVFSYNGQWKFVSTGTANSPYLRFRVTGGGGCIQHKTIVTAEDANGNPAIYWLSPRGPMRITANGQEYLGEDINDIWQTVNLDATTMVGHAVFHADLHQVWFYIATGTSNTPNKRLVFDTRFGQASESSGVRKGWALHEGESTKAYCSAMFSNVIGAAMSRLLKPHIGYTTSTVIAKCDTTDADDMGIAFQAYLDSRSVAPWGLGKLGGMTKDAVLVAVAAAGVTVQLSIYRNEGQEVLASTADLTDKSDSGAADLVFPQFEGSRVSETCTFRCRIGDAVANTNTWNLSALVIPVEFEGDI